MTAPSRILRNPRMRLASVSDIHAWSAELLAVPYGHAAMAALARHNGREDWAVALETGYALRA